MVRPFSISIHSIRENPDTPVAFNFIRSDLSLKSDDTLIFIEGVFLVAFANDLMNYTINQNFLSWHLGETSILHVLVSGGRGEMTLSIIDNRMRLSYRKTVHKSSPVIQDPEYLDTDLMTFNATVGEFYREAIELGLPGLDEAPNRTEILYSLSCFAQLSGRRP